MNARTRRVGTSAALGGLVLLVVLAAASALTVLVLGRVPDRREGALAGPALIAGAVAIVTFHPLHRRFTDTVRERRGGRTPDEVLASFGDRAARGIAIDELLLQLAESVRHTMRMRRAEVWVLDGATLTRVASVPDAGQAELALDPKEIDALGRAGTAGEHWLHRWAPQLAPAGQVDAGEVRVAPARHAGQLLGLILVDRAPGAERLADVDDRALGDLGRRLGDVLRTRQLDAALRATLDDLRRSNEDLRASRARLVAVADQERRRIERDLHDGAQQHLVALAMSLGLVRDLIGADPAGATGMLDELTADLRDTVQQLRDLAHGVYPPMLREGGLAPALAAAARRAAVTTTLRAETTERASSEVEAALYFCCLEALQNAAKHAADTQVHVTLRCDRPGWLELTVHDDGPGFDPERTVAGQGLQNMADRVGAVGGTLSVDARPDAGVRVVASVPMGERP